MTLISTPTRTVATQSSKARTRKRGGLLKRNAAKTGYSVLALILGLIVWQLVAWAMGPSLMSSPAATLSAAIELIADGTLQVSITASLVRILVGWSLGIVAGVAIGLLMATIPVVRRLVDPYIQFFRFIPPIAFVTLAIAWFGTGETSKIILIFYTSVFIITVNTIAGVMAINPSKILAAKSLGASQAQSFFQVVLPSTVPYLVTGARLALGNSFLTIISAELVAAQIGLGALIWNSRNFGRIDWIFVGIITLGIVGFLCDVLIRLFGNKVLAKYGVKA